MNSVGSYVLVTSYTFTGLTNGAVHYFVVFTAGTCGNLTLTEAVSATSSSPTRPSMDASFIVLGVIAAAVATGAVVFVLKRKRK